MQATASIALCEHIGVTCNHHLHGADLEIEELSENVDAQALSKIVVDLVERILASPASRCNKITPLTFAGVFCFVFSNVGMYTTEGLPCLNCIFYGFEDDNALSARLAGRCFNCVTLHTVDEWMAIAANRSAWFQNTEEGRAQLRKIACLFECQSEL
jgi:hypothetical protein